MSINERVKLLREALGKSQEHFGTSIGISKSGVSNIESGIRNVTEKHIKLICLSFPVNESWLRTGEGDMFSTDDKGEDLEQMLTLLSNDELIKRIIRSYLNLDESGKLALQKLIDAFASSESGASGLSADSAQLPKDDAPPTDRIEPDVDKQVQTQPDIAAELAELKRQNQELAAKVAAMEEEDIANGLWDGLSASPSASVGKFSPGVKK